MKERQTRAGQRRSTQAGAVLLPVAAALMVGMMLLGAAQLGHYFSLKRALQTTADLAALAGAGALEAGDLTGCQQAQQAAGLVIANQGGALGDVQASGQVDIACGVWHTDQSDEARRFMPALPAGAVQVQLGQTVEPIFPFFPSTLLRASAVADTGRPVATFSVGSRLVSLSRDGLVYDLLTGVGLSPGQLSILDAAGLVTARVTPAGLLEALGLPPTVIAGVGTPAELAQLDALTLGDLLDAGLTVLAQQRLLGADVAALESLVQLLLGVPSLNVPIRLFGDQGVIAIAEGGNPLAALNAEMNLVDLLGTSLLIANGDNLIDLNLNALPGASVFNQSLETRLRVVEPPSLAIGGVGTTANSAGVRLYLRLRSDNVPAVGPILNALGTRISLPLIVELSQAQGELLEICPANHPKQARIGVTMSLVNVCLGTFPNSDFFSSQHSCSDAARFPIGDHEIINVLGILPIRTSVNLSLLGTTTPLEEDLVAPETKVFRPRNLPVAESAKLLADTVVAGVLGKITSNGNSLGTMTSAQKGQMAASLVGPGRGRSVSQVVNEMQWSQQRMQALGQTMTNNGLIGVLGGTLTLVDQLLTTLLAAPLSDVACALADLGGVAAGNQCRRNAVENLVLRDNNMLGALLSMVMALLEPILQALSAVLNALLQSLGVNVLEADVTLHDVQCGQAHLVR